MGKRQLSFSELEGKYKKRRPEETVLYQGAASSYRTFEAAAAASGKSLPIHVTQEFKAFLRCGVLPVLVITR